MKAKFEIHPIQAHIIRALIFSPQARFAKLNVLGVPTDQFTFHVNSLVDAGIIEKVSRGLYQLTLDGKEFANRFDTEKVAIERQAKVTVIIGCVRQNGNTKEFLIQQRLKQPYFGYHGFISGKITWGSTPLETAARELKEETGLEAKGLKLIGIKHKMDYDGVGKLLEDKYFFVVSIKKSSGNLITNFEGGKNMWLSKKAILKIPKLFDGVEETINLLEGKKLAYTEHRYIVHGF